MEKGFSVCIHSKKEVIGILKLILQHRQKIVQKLAYKLEETKAF